MILNRSQEEKKEYIIVEDVNFESESKSKRYWIEKYCIHKQRADNAVEDRDTVMRDLEISKADHVRDVKNLRIQIQNLKAQLGVREETILFHKNEIKNLEIKSLECDALRKLVEEKNLQRNFTRTGRIVNVEHGRSLSNTSTLIATSPSPVVSGPWDEGRREVRQKRNRKRKICH